MVNILGLELHFCDFVPVRHANSCSHDTGRVVMMYFQKFSKVSALVQ
jgi:hypothetical protein